jgi:DNA polymerase III epsilon subunit-like protein
MDSKKQTDGELVKSFIEWSASCKEKTLAGQNPSFDRDFMQMAAQRSHIDWPFAHRTIDLHSLCFMHMVRAGIVPPVLKGRSDLNSEKIMKYVGIPKEKHPHNALNCTITEAEAISRLLYDKKLLLEFREYEIPWLAVKK